MDSFVYGFLTALFVVLVIGLVKWWPTTEADPVEGLPEAAGHDFPLVTRSEEELLRLADAWKIVHTLMAECEGEPYELPQDRLVQGFIGLGAAVDGEQRCLEDAEYFELRTMALAEMRMAEQTTNPPPKENTSE